MSLDPITRKEIFMAKAAGEKVSDITPVTREEIFLSRIAGGGGGGGGADLLNADGVIKQEHLPEGYPYKTVEEGYILEECQPIDAGEGMLILTDFINEKLEAGKEYTVNYNGTDYKTTALELEGVGIGLGNAGYILEDESLITDEPYALIAFSPESELASQGIGVMILPVDGSTSVTVSIKGEVAKYQQINERYLPELKAQKRFFVDLDSNTTTLTPKVAAEMDIEELCRSIVVLWGGEELVVNSIERKTTNSMGYEVFTLYCLFTKSDAYNRMNYSFEIQAVVDVNNIVIKAFESEKSKTFVPLANAYETHLLMHQGGPSNNFMWIEPNRTMLPLLQFKTPSGDYYLLSVDNSGAVITQQCNESGQVIN